LPLRAVLAGPVRTVEGISAVGRETGGRRENLLIRHTEFRSDLSSRRQPAQPLSQIVANPGHLQRQVTQRPGHVHTPHPVPEMALDLTGDGGRGVGDEGMPAIRVVPVDGFDQGQRGHLTQVVKILAAVLERAGQSVRQRQIEPHSLVTQSPAFLGRTSGPAKTAYQLGCDVVTVVLLRRTSGLGTFGAFYCVRVGKRSRHDLPQVVSAAPAMASTHGGSGRPGVDVERRAGGAPPAYPSPDNQNASRRPVIDLP
jgi:hypothetical protein